MAMTTQLSIKTGLFYIHEPVVNMRESPTNKSKVVSQTIFSEKISIEKKVDDWSLIKTSDAYIGWIPTDACLPVAQPYKGTMKTTRLAAHLYGVMDTEFGP